MTSFVHKGLIYAVFELQKITVLQQSPKVQHLLQISQLPPVLADALLFILTAAGLMQGLRLRMLSCPALLLYAGCAPCQCISLKLQLFFESCTSALKTDLY